MLGNPERVPLKRILAYVCFGYIGLYALYFVTSFSSYVLPSEDILMVMMLGYPQTILAIMAALGGIVLTALDFREVPLVIMAGGLAVVVLLGFVYLVATMTVIALYGVVVVILCARYISTSHRKRAADHFVNEEYKCSECQADVREEDKICPKCGAKLDEIEED